MPPPPSTTRPVPPGMDGRLWMQMKAAFNDDPKARLHACVRENDISTLRELLPLCGTGELDLNYCDLDFGSALQVAVLCDNMTAVGILLDAGASPWAFNGSTEPQTSALDAAIQTGNRDMFTRICENMTLGIDKTSQQRYRTLLDRTALNGQAAMVEDVLGWAGGWSEATLEHALGNAVSGWHVEVVRLLLDRFDYSPLCINSSLCRAADFRSDLLGHPRAECTGLDYMNQQQLISCLVDAGADPNSNHEEENIVIKAATWVDLVGALKALLENGADPNERGPARETALHHLGSPVHIKKGPKRCLHETGIRLLLQHGASVVIQDELGNTPLHYAAFGSNMRIFRLYTSGLDVDNSHSDALKSIKNYSGETLLHWAAAGKKIDTLRFLLLSGADVNAANDNGWSPLMCALAPSSAIETSMPRRYKTLQAARLLLDHGADPLASTAEGWTPLHCLSLYLDDSDSKNNELAELAKEFIAKGIPVDARATMLAVSTTSGRKSLRVSNREVGIWGSRVVEHLQPNRNESPATTKDRTPLHWAMFYGAVGLASVLLANGADVNAVDEKNNLPADLANSSPVLQTHAELRAKLTQILIDATKSSVEHSQKQQRTT
ncbi:Ankyrin-3 [Metarhizium anisopliae]|nr:Ankyrin-3 [Metarhizium anisopliae]